MSRRLAVLVGGACLLASVSRAAAHTFTVDSEADAVDAQPGDGVCASADGRCTLRAAVQETNALDGADVINIPSGYYKLTIPPNGEDTAAAGDIDITDDLKIIGTGPAVVIDGGGQDRVFRVHTLKAYARAEVTIRGVTIQNGKAPEGEGGGGISSDGNLTLQDVTVINNRAVSGPLQNDGRGGGIANRRGDLTLAHAIVSNNNADDAGGGIVNLHGRVTLTNTVMRDNASFTDRGGAIENDGALTVARCNIVHNSAEEAGGGIASLGGSVTITSSSISENAAVAGGGMAALGGMVSLANTTVGRNHARLQGGGLFDRAPGAMELNNVTIAENTTDGTAQSGGGGIAIAKGARVNLSNTLVAGNVDSRQHGQDCFGTLVSYGYNLLQIAKGCNVQGTTASNIVGKDPQLAPLSESADFMRTYALRRGSPAIDAGNPALPGSGDSTCETDDQRGVARPVDGDGNGVARCDIGAFELQPAAATPTR